MRVAFCFYGQPRDYKTGYTNINNFILYNNDVIFDFFYHTWTLDKDMLYPTAPWRHIPNKERQYNNNTIDELKKMYSPKACEDEIQKTHFDPTFYINSLAYKNNTKQINIDNISNIISQMYSRNKVRNILDTYIKTHNVTYDAVIMCRFDYKNKINFKLSDFDLSYTYLSNVYYPRKIIADNLLIMPTNVFLTWFNIYENMGKVLNSQEVEERVKSYGETLYINPEEILFANYLLHYKNIDNLRYISQISFGL